MPILYIYFNEKYINVLSPIWISSLENFSSKLHLEQQFVRVLQRACHVTLSVINLLNSQVQISISPIVFASRLKIVKRICLDRKAQSQSRQEKHKKLLQRKHLCWVLSFVFLRYILYLHKQIKKCTSTSSQLKLTKQSHLIQLQNVLLF